MTCGNMNSLEDFSCHPGLRSSLFHKRGCGGHDLPDRLCWNTPYCAETDLNTFIGNAGDGPLCGLSPEMLDTD